LFGFLLCSGLMTNKRIYYIYGDFQQGVGWTALQYCIKQLGLRLPSALLYSNQMVVQKTEISSHFRPHFKKHNREMTFQILDDSTAPRQLC